jgi:hypothetical protein
MQKSNKIIHQTKNPPQLNKQPLQLKNILKKALSSNSADSARVHGASRAWKRKMQKSN